MPSQKIFASPQDVEAAFYEALERCDIEAMMAVWAEDEEVVCVHPGGPRLVGYINIREAWQRVFASASKLRVRLSQQTSISTPFAMVSTLLQHIATADNENQSAPVAATNVYVRGALGWRMVAHHASPVPPGSIGEAPRTLH
ncbi:MAG: nuclear transport factor 2 family protein [Sulfuritalea sp.]|nr:nuclear transport factor 2 family protein [Sulfuritalea sp.]MDP1984290.1 nuclear transport factor 2 family protein [Sulfuritalea sp.]